MAISLTASGVTKTHNGYFIIHFNYTGSDNITRSYVVATRSQSEFYIDAMRAIAGLPGGSTYDTDIINFSANTLAPKFNNPGTVGYDVSP